MSAFSSHNRSDLEDLLAIILRHAGVKSAKTNSKQLLYEVEVSVELYHRDKAETFKQGPARTALLKLWRSADKGSDKAVLYNLLSQLPYSALDYLEKRALRLSGSLNLGDLSKDGLLNWADNASVDAPKKMIIFCAAVGRQISQGRKRSNTKQSRDRVEPVILGTADRITPPKNKDDEIQLDGELTRMIEVSLDAERGSKYKKTTLADAERRSVLVVAGARNHRQLPLKCLV